MYGSNGTLLCPVQPSQGRKSNSERVTHPVDAENKTKGPVITIGMLELMWVFTTVERVNFTPNWLRTILFVYDF